MSVKTAALLVGYLAVATSANAQTPLVHANPTSGCTVSREEQEANRRVAMEFYRPGITPEQRIALIDPGYIQHNAVLKKAAQQQGISDYQAFINAFSGGGRGGRPGGPGPGGPGPGGPGGPGAAAGGPQPPPGNQYEVVTAECDLVTMVNRIVRQDPTAAPGTWYETFGFDTFRVRNGKLVEHWDGAVINAPAPPAPPAPATGIFGGNIGHFVSDMPRAIAFYRDVLGLTVRTDGAAPYPWAGEAALRAGSVATVAIPGSDWALDLVQRAQGSTPFRPRMQDPGALTLILFVRNLDALLARARAANAPIVTTGGTAGVGPNGSIKASVIQAPDGEFIELLEQPQDAAGAAPGAPPSVLRANVRVTVANASEAARAYDSLLGVTFRGNATPVGDAGVPFMLGQPGATFYLRNVQFPGSGMTFELLQIEGPAKTSTPIQRGTPGSSYLRLGLVPSRMPATGADMARDNVFLAIRALQP